jgi:hypothetical protein
MATTQQKNAKMSNNLTSIAQCSLDNISSLLIPLPYHQEKTIKDGT